MSLIKFHKYVLWVRINFFTQQKHSGSYLNPLQLQFKCLNVVLLDVKEIVLEVKKKVKLFMC